MIAIFWEAIINTIIRSFFDERIICIHIELIRTKKITWAERKRNHHQLFIRLLLDANSRYVLRHCFVSFRNLYIFPEDKRSR